MDGQNKPALTLLFLYGKGGSGKDTQARRMYQDHPDWVGISTGDVIRDAIKDPTHKFHSKVVKREDEVNKGVFVPDSVVIDIDNPSEGIYSEFVKEQIAASAPAIVSTGFPRTVSQSELLDEYIFRLRETYDVVDQHVYLDVSDETTKRRASERREHDLRTTGKSRKDDEPNVVEDRLRIFYELTYPIMERLQSQGRLIRINAEASIEEVHKETMAELFPLSLEIREPGEASLRGKERF